VAPLLPKPQELFLPPIIKSKSASPTSDHILPQAHFQPKPSNNMPFHPSKDSESNRSNLPINLLLSSSLFPAGSSTLEDSSPSTSRRGSGVQMSRSELRSVLQDAIDLIDEEIIESFWGDTESSSKDQ
jgi:hypothetical protein